MKEEKTFGGVTNSGEREMKWCVGLELRRRVIREAPVRIRVLEDAIFGDSEINLMVSLSFKTTQSDKPRLFSFSYSSFFFSQKGSVSFTRYHIVTKKITNITVRT